jgi:hypothetical protein
VVIALLKEAQLIGDEGQRVQSSSFCILFPNQDVLSGKGLGNLIAMPFQGKAVREDNTLLLDPRTGFKHPYHDQWGELASIERVPESKLDELIDAWDLKPEQPYPANISGPHAVTENLLQCDFIKWAKEHPEDVPEPLWYCLISNLVSIRPGGYTLCHELSKGYPEYSRQETDAKIHHALDASGPITCQKIRADGFKCKKECSARSPAALARNLLRINNGVQKRWENILERY